MDDSAAARLAGSLRTAMKDQALNGAGLADRIERLGEPRPTPTWISRRLGSPAISPRPDSQSIATRAQPLIKVDPDLFVIARALEVERAALIDMVVTAVFGEEES